jgi:hypothetical protein
MVAIQAEESMRHSTVISVGNGLLKKRDADSLWKGWKKSAMGEQQKMNKQALGAAIAASGIKIEERRHG